MTKELTPPPGWELPQWVKTLAAQDPDNTASLPREVILEARKAVNIYGSAETYSQIRLAYAFLAQSAGVTEGKNPKSQRAKFIFAVLGGTRKVFQEILREVSGLEDEELMSRSAE